MMHAIACRTPWADRALVTSASLLTALITLLVCVDVGVCRLANASLAGANASAILMLIALVLLGFAGAEARGENFPFTILLQSHNPGLQQVLNFLACLVSLATVSSLTWFSWTRAIASTLSREESDGAIACPVWPSKSLIAFGLTPLALQRVASLLGSSDEGQDRAP